MQKSKGVEGYKGSGEAKQKGRTAEGWKSRGIAWGVMSHGRFEGYEGSGIEESKDRGVTR